jgi:predicted DNA-binding protein YlxM (UPF0122 family)
MLDDLIKIGFLYDFYSELLPERQREIIKLYYDDNLSLGEIAEEYGLTRQGIHENIKRGERKLEDFEAKLKLIEKYRKGKDIVSRLKADMDQLISSRNEDRDLIEKLKEYKETISLLNQ